MKELSKWAWIILLCILGLGFWFFYIMAAFTLIFLIIIKFRPEWVENDPVRSKEIKQRRYEDAVFKRYQKQIKKEECPDNCVAFEDLHDGKKTVRLYWLFVEDQPIDRSYYDNKVFHIDFKLTNKMDGIILQIKSKSEDVKAIKWSDSTFNGFQIEVDGLKEEDRQCDELQPNATVKRIIRIDNSNDNKKDTRKMINESAGYMKRMLNLKLKCFYKDNITEIFKISLQVKKLVYEYDYEDLSPKKFAGEEMLPETKEMGWATYVTKNNVKFYKGQAFVISDVFSSKAYLNEIIEVPKGTPVLLKAWGKQYAKIVDNPTKYNYKNRLKVSDGKVSDGIYILANKSRGVGFYKWDGGPLEEGVVYMPSNAACIDDFVDIKIESKN